MQQFTEVNLAIGGWWSIGFSFILGAVIGSFVQLIIERTLFRKLAKSNTEKITTLAISSKLKDYLKNNSLSVNKPQRSFCFACGRQLLWWENIPLLSYLMLSGKCRTCQIPIPAMTLWTESVFAISFAVIAGNWGWDFVTICIATSASVIYIYVVMKFKHVQFLQNF